MQEAKSRKDKPVELIFKPTTYGEWNSLSGWTLKKEEGCMGYMGTIPNSDLEILPETTEIDKAMKALFRINEKTGKPVMPNDGVYVMSFAHFFLNSQIVKTYLHEIAYQFIHSHKKLILLVPEIVDIPVELEDFVAFLNFSVPSDPERVALVRDVYEAHSSLDKLSVVDEEIISTSGAGMTSYELSNSVSRAIVQLKDDQKTVPEKDVILPGKQVAKLVMQNKTEMLERSNVLEVLEPVPIEEVGGIELLKEWAKMRIDSFGPDAEEFGVDRPKGIALGGVPGSGKSLCAKALGSVFNIPVIKFELSNVFGGLVGQSEKQTKHTLSLIEAQSNCIVLLDEVDKMFNMDTGGGDSGTSLRVLGLILTFMQESKAKCFWVFTFNRAEGLPPELLRKGRLDEVFSVGLPTLKEREQIFRIHLKKRKKNPDSISNLEEAINKSAGFVASEIEAAVKEAILESWHYKTDLTGESIAKQFGNMRALSIAFKDQVERMEKWATENARPASLPEDKSVSIAAANKSGKKRDLLAVDY